MGTNARFIDLILSVALGKRDIHRQFTLLNLSRDFKRCDSFNRKCGGFKNGGRCFDGDGRILDLAHFVCSRCILTTESENQPGFVPVHPMGAWPQIPLILCLVHTQRVPIKMDIGSTMICT